jgi:hypothetical protein
VRSQGNAGEKKKGKRKKEKEKRKKEKKKKRTEGKTNPEGTQHVLHAGRGLLG